MRWLDAYGTSLRNFVATVANRYGAKAVDVVVLAVASRVLSMDEVGTLFLAGAAAGIVSRVTDLGLFPVLMRRVARAEATWRNVARLALARLGLVVVATGVFGFVAHEAFPQHAWLTTGFFFGFGLQSVHEVGRAVLAGQELFVGNAMIGVSAKVLGGVLAIAGLATGFGSAAWPVGLAVGQVGTCLAVFRLARRAMRQAEPVRTRVLVREGLPYWLVNVANVVSTRLATVLVAAWAGFAETANIGIASRVTGGLLVLVSALGHVAFPSIARQPRSMVTGAQLRIVGALAFGLGVAVLIAAPWIVQLLTGQRDPNAVIILRIMAPALTLASLSRPLEIWLQARNEGAKLLWATLVSSAVAVASTVVLTRLYQTEGAAAARVLRSAFALLAVGLVTVMAVRASRLRASD